MVGCAAVAGVALSGQVTLMTTAVQLFVPGSALGKVFGLQSSLMLALAALAMVAAGAAAEVISVPLLLTGSGAAMVVASLLILAAPKARRVFAATGDE